MIQTRRRILLSSVAGAVAAGAVALESWRLFARHYPPTPYDDLLDLLPDREAAKTVGRVFLSGHPNFGANGAAGALRGRIRGRELSVVAMQEISQIQLSVAGGWILPATLLGLCALAAKT